MTMRNALRSAQLGCAASLPRGKGASSMTMRNALRSAQLGCAASLPRGKGASSGTKYAISYFPLTC